MIDIPIGKALAKVEVKYASCSDCILLGKRECFGAGFVSCTTEIGSKPVIFKLVDYPAGEQPCSGNYCNANRSFLRGQNNVAV